MDIFSNFGKGCHLQVVDGFDQRRIHKNVDQLLVLEGMLGKSEGVKRLQRK